jgi:hypothetical protein
MHVQTAADDAEELLPDRRYSAERTGWLSLGRLVLQSPTARRHAPGTRVQHVLA